MPWEFEEKMFLGSYVDVRKIANAPEEYGGSYGGYYEEASYYCPVCRRARQRSVTYSDEQSLKTDPLFRLCADCRKAREDWDAADYQQQKKLALKIAAIGLPNLAGIVGLILWLAFEIGKRRKK